MHITGAPFTNRLIGRLVSDRKILIKAIFTIIICVSVYLPAFQGGFVWDDESMLTNNIIHENNGLYRTWFTTEQTNYWPITWTTYWLEHNLWGLNPIGYHITNILIHIACSLLIWRILVLLKIPVPWLAALIFAVHPVNVESVAWIAQRKTILAMLFFLITILLYLKFEGSNDYLLYWLSAGTFTLAMLSKGSVVGLPIVLLLIIWWQRGTITRRDILHTLPFFAISAVMSCVEIWFQTNRAIGEGIVRNENFLARVSAAGMAVWFYIYKAISPLNLAFIYPRWQINTTNLLSYVPAALLLGLFLLLWRYRRTWARPLLFALTYNVAMLFPILGFFTIYFMKYSFVADHYQYVSIISIVSPITAAGYFIAIHFGTARMSLVKVIAALIVITLGILTWRQCYIYKDEKILWNDTLRKNPNCAMVHYNLANVLRSEGKFDEAVSQYRNAIFIDPDYTKAYNNLGVALESQGKFDDALLNFNYALKLNPDYSDVHHNIAALLQSQGKVDEAAGHLLQALKINPDDFEAHYNIAAIFESQGKFDEAISHYQQALRIRPDYAHAHNNLAVILKAHGRLDDAASHYLLALKAKPDDPIAYYNLANLFLSQGKIDDAIDCYRRAIQLKPDYVEAHCNLGAALESQGKFDEAIESYHKALELTAAVKNDKLADQIRDRLKVCEQTKKALSNHN